MESPLFLLGAGFNNDAKKEAGNTKGESGGYPLVSDLYRLCFPANDSSISIEELFDDALKKNNYEPLKKLYDLIMKADHDIAGKLLFEKEYSKNCYSKFFNDFQQSSFLTFNYDSLPEVFLLQLESWFPHDGYGVPVEIGFNWSIGIDEKKIKEHLAKKSRSLVLHLHGSLCIYIKDFKIENNLIKIKDKPVFKFDPSSISNNFHPYEKAKLDPSYSPNIEERVIAPIPDKSEGLKNKFIKQMYAIATKLLTHTNKIIVIGYNFSTHDKSSYHTLLEHLSNQKSGTLLIVSPSALDITNRMKKEYPSIEWLRIDATFKEWVDSDYDGIDN
jgi:hypothetical protein